MEKSKSTARHQRAFVQFLSRHELGRDFACVCHNDADGVSSAAAASLSC
jgi:hypothetical protein